MMFGNVHAKGAYMIRYLPTVLLGTALTLSLNVSPLRADHEGRSYHDDRGKDDHHWDSHEDKALRIWEREQHRKHKISPSSNTKIRKITGHGAISTLMHC